MVVGEPFVLGSVTYAIPTARYDGEEVPLTMIATYYVNYHHMTAVRKGCMLKNRLYFTLSRTFGSHHCCGHLLMWRRAEQAPLEASTRAPASSTASTATASDNGAAGVATTIAGVAKYLIGPMVTDELPFDLFHLQLRLFT